MSKKTVPFDSKGHWLHRDRETATVEITVIDFGDGSPHFYVSRGDMSYSCALCGSYVELSDDNPEKVSAKEPCPVSEGITSVIRLEVPSGKIVVDDSMGPLFEGFDHDGFASYNSALGQHQVIEAFAKDKCAFGPVGNSCPTLWQTGEGTYIIANKPWVEALDDPWMDEDDVLAPEGARKLASICTDLWAYSIVDFDEWVRRGGVLVPKYNKETGETEQVPESWTTTIVEIPAGTYEFTHHTNELGFDGDADDVVYADIKKID